MQSGKNETPLLAVQKGKKYNPENLKGKRFFRHFSQGNELKVWEGEKIYLKSTKKQVLADVVKDISSDETYSALLLQILCAVGGASRISTLVELFLMYCGHRATTEDFLIAKQKLEKLSLISTGIIAQGPKKTAQELPVKSLEFVHITFFGSMVAYMTVAGGMRLMSANSRAMNVPEVKATLQSADIILRLLKNGQLSNFSYKPLYSKVINKNRRKMRSFCSPLYRMNLKGAEVIYYNCRKTDNWLKAILQELNRVNLVFGAKIPTIIIATEDMFMNAELFKALMKRKRIRANILFTDDETLAKAKDNRILYTLTISDGKIVKKQ